MEDGWVVGLADREGSVEGIEEGCEVGMVEGAEDG